MAPLPPLMPFVWPIKGGVDGWVTFVVMGLVGEGWIAAVVAAVVGAGWRFWVRR